MLDVGAEGLLIRFHRPRLNQQFLLHFHPWRAKMRLQPAVNENKQIRELIKGDL